MIADARQPTGAIIEHKAKDGRIYRSLRFSAYGRRRFISLGAVTARKAEAELRHVLADVERGTWQPPRAVESPEADPVPMFHQYAEAWWLRVERQLAAKTREDYRWRLEKHLLLYFELMPIDAIKVATVKDCIAAKQGEANPLSPRSLKMTLTLLGAILEDALDSEVIDGRNPARGRKIAAGNRSGAVSRQRLRSQPC